MNNNSSSAMALPSANPMPLAFNCPAGLEPLLWADALLVCQQIELLEVFTGFETNNKYQVSNSAGQVIYFVVEDTGCCARNCLGSSRPFKLRIFNLAGSEVMVMEAPMRCDCLCCPCCLGEVSVFAPVGQLIGSVKQNWSICQREFQVRDVNENTTLMVRGSCCACMQCGHVTFDVTTPHDETPIGQVTKHFSGFLREIFTDADNFGVTFPLDLDVKAKATLLGALFLIDFIMFENNEVNRRGGFGRMI